VNIRPCSLTGRERAILQPAVDRGGHDWTEIEGWLADGCGQLWDIDGRAVCLTVAYEDNTLVAVLMAGEGAREWVPPFVEAMRSVPQHRGMRFQAIGRKGWARLLPGWRCDDRGDHVILTEP